jgi:hypothetical protein
MSYINYAGHVEQIVGLMQVTDSGFVQAGPRNHQQGVSVSLIATRRLRSAFVIRAPRSMWFHEQIAKVRRLRVSYVPRAATCRAKAATRIVHRRRTQLLCTSFHQHHVVPTC